MCSHSHFQRLAVAASFILLTTALPVAAQGPIPTPIPRGPISIELQPAATGLTAPNLLIPSSDGTGRLFIVEQTGQVKILSGGVVQTSPFLDVSGAINTIVNGTPPNTTNGLRTNFDERGLLGLAFDPGFTNPSSPGFRRVFTYHTEGVNATADFTFPPPLGPINSQNVVSSWRVDPSNPNLVDPASRVELFRMDKPQFNHNAGHIEFGPDGMLYVATGDGGGANDGGSTNVNNQIGHNATIGNGQDTNVILGKILRIDPNGNNSANGRYGIPPTNPFANGVGGLREVYAHGFRNPFRFSFDGNRLLAADVGQNNIEELDDVVLGGNYGWRYKEGTFRFITPTGTVSTDLSGLPAGLIDPILQYDHDEGISIIGGFVYHGSAIPELAGKYVFGDFSRSFASPQGRLFYADLSVPGDIHEFMIGVDDRALGLFVKGFGIDAAGELYVLGGTIGGPTGTAGVALKIVPVPEPAATTAAIALAGVGLLSRRRPE